MWRHFSLALVLVAHNDVVIVDGQPFVGVDGDTEETRVGVDQEDLVTGAQVVDDRSLRQVSHVGHVLEQLVLWRVLGLDIVRLEELDFSIDQAFDFDLAVLLLASLLTLSVTSLGVWNPTGGTAFKGSVSKIIVNFSKLNPLLPDIDQGYIIQTKVLGGIAGGFGIPESHFY